MAIYPELAGKVAIVTGGGVGIGEAIVRLLVANRVNVAVVGRRNREPVEAVVEWARGEGVKALAVMADVSVPDQVERLFAEVEAGLGPVDILVNNAGYALWKPLEATAIAEWDHIFAVNVRAAAYLCAAVLPDMQDRGFGRVINIGSEAGVAIVPDLAAYCVSKHALRALTEVIQDGHHDNGIKAWVICPGFVDTDMSHDIPDLNPSNFLRVDEVVDVVRFLLHTGDNVKLGPEILVRTMRNPMAT
jgi:NAD(P)-dependent dehydrogenase (short-subunit alcohol dehydrogenase family)